MRPASDLPRQRSQRRISRRGAVIGGLILLVVLVLFSRALAQFYIDALWHDALGRSDVFWGQLRAKLTMFAIFFFAFLPQFVSTDTINPLPQMLALSGVFMLLTFVVFVIYGLFAASVRNHVISRPQVMTWMRRIFAGAFVALGAKLAVADR